MLLEATLRLAAGMQVTQTVFLERMGKTEEGLKNLNTELQDCNTQLEESFGGRDKDFGAAVEGLQRAEDQQVRTEIGRRQKEVVRLGGQ